MPTESPSLAVSRAVLEAGGLAEGVRLLLFGSAAKLGAGNDLDLLIVYEESAHSDALALRRRLLDDPRLGLLDITFLGATEERATQFATKVGALPLDGRDS